MRFLDGAAQALELVGLAEQASSIALLLEVLFAPITGIQPREDSTGLPSDRGRSGTPPGNLAQRQGRTRRSNLGLIELCERQASGLKTNRPNVHELSHS